MMEPCGSVRYSVAQQNESYVHMLTPKCYITWGTQVATEWQVAPTQNVQLQRNRRHVPNACICVMQAVLWLLAGRHAAPWVCS
jgi:hypothetical protein